MNEWTAPKINIEAALEKGKPPTKKQIQQVQKAIAKGRLPADYDWSSKTSKQVTDDLADVGIGCHRRTFIERCVWGRGRGNKPAESQTALDVATPKPLRKYIGKVEEKKTEQMVIE